jgi:hypothetical protein
MFGQCPVRPVRTAFKVVIIRIQCALRALHPVNNAFAFWIAGFTNGYAGIGVELL